MKFKKSIILIEHTMTIQFLVKGGLAMLSGVPSLNLRLSFVFVNLFRSPGIDSQATWAVDSSESIPGLLKRLQIRALHSNNERSSVE